MKKYHVWNRVGNKLSGQIRESVDQWVGMQVEDRISNHIEVQVLDQVKDHIWDDMKNG